MSLMDEEQTVFRQFAFRKFKTWSSITSKTFNNYSMLMTDNSDNLEIS